MGEIDAVRVVGPTAPATSFQQSGVESASAACRASSPAVLFISKTRCCRLKSDCETEVPLKVFVSMMSAPAAR